VVAIAVASSACGPQAGSLQAANETLGAAQVNAIEFSGTGRWYQFGQAPAPNLPWPQFDVSSYTATINYATPAARVQMTRKQTIEPGRVRPAPVEQKPDQYVSGQRRGTSRHRRCRAQRRRPSRSRSRRRRGTRDGDLDDAARIPESRGGQQRDVHAE
jgi:hypothetical protein